MDLFLLRHGDSGKRIPVVGGGSRYNNSVDPSLTVTGIEEIAMIARSIKKLNLKFDAIIASPLKSAIQTANIVARVLEGKNKMTIWNELAPEGNRLDLCNRLHHQFTMESTILAIGHEPYISNLICGIISQGNSQGSTIRKGAGDRRRSTIIMKKGGFAKVRIISLAPSIKGELRWLLTPRILKSLIKKRVARIQNQTMLLHYMKT